MPSFKDSDSSKIYYRKCFRVFKIPRERVETQSGKHPNDRGWDVGSGFPFWVQRHLAVQLGRFCRVGYYPKEILKLCQPQLLQGTRILQSKTRAEHRQPPACQSGDCAWPFSVLHPISHSHSPAVSSDSSCSRIDRLQCPWGEKHNPRAFNPCASSQEIGKRREKSNKNSSTDDWEGFCI